MKFAEFIRYCATRGFQWLGSISYRDWVVAWLKWRDNALLQFCDFYAPLTHTAVPQRAAPGTTGTFTRATTKTVENNDGYLVTLLAGEIGFPGARRVRNLLTFTEDFSNAAWVKPTGCTIGSNVVANPINGALTADKIIPPVSASWHSVYQSYSLSGATHNYSIYLKNAGYNFVYISPDGGTSGVTINLTTGATTTSGSVTAAATSVGNGWWRVSCLSSVTTNTIRVYPGSTTAPESFTGDGTSGIYAWGAQLEDVTAQTTQTAGEYVSVGVTSAPYYHGSFVDGVKCFPTDLSGNPIPAATMLGYQAEGARTNLCLQSNAFTTAPWGATGTPAATQNVVGPDGATSAWTFTDDAAGATESVYQAITLTAAAWTASVFMKKTSGSLTAYPVIFFYPGDGTQVQAATVDTTNGVITDWTSADASTMASGRSVRIVSYNDDFWRVELTKTGTAAVHFFQFFPAGATTATYAGPTISTAAQGSAVFANAQVELGSFASSYIPTTTIAVARNADVLTYSGGDIPNLKTLCATFSQPIAPTTPSAVVSLDNGGSQWAYWYYLGTTIDTANRIKFQGYNGAVQWEVYGNQTQGATEIAAFSMATNGSKFAKDGAALTPDVSAAMPSYDRISVGHLGGNFQLYGNVTGIYGWTRNLSQSELNAVTACATT